MNFENKPVTPVESASDAQAPTAENINGISAKIKSMKRFANRMPDVQKMITEFTQWSRGENWDSQERKENYPNWTKEHFLEVVTLAELE